MNAAISNHFPSHSICTRCKAECIRYSPFEERLDVRLGLSHTPERCEAKRLSVPAWVDVIQPA